MDGYSKEQEMVGNFICLAWINADRGLREMEDEISSLEFRIANYSPEFDKDFSIFLKIAIQDINCLVKELEEKKKEIEKYRQEIWSKALSLCDFSILNHETCKLVLQFKTLT